MIISNEKMNKYCNGTSSLDLNAIKGFEFTKLGDGYFFVRMVDENVMKVARIYSISKDDDWAGFEYGTNKIHLEDELQGTISEITFASVKLVKFLFDRFKERFPAESPVFWLSCNEFTEYPSVTLGFYVKRPGMTPLISENSAELENYSDALLIVL